jgi:hypothetical protein
MTTQREAPDANALKERQVKIWTSGEYARIGNPISIMGEILCEAVDLRSGDRVLDVATGSGNTAISAARRVDRTRPQARRSGGHGDNVRGRRRRGSVIPRRFLRRGSLHHRGDVLPEPGEGGELLRVCRPGGKIGLASWTPDSFTGNMLKTVGKHVPPPPGVKPPSLWGTEERLQELLGTGVASLRTTRRTYNFRYPSVEHYVGWFREYYGPTVRAFAALDPEGQEALAADLWELCASRNVADDGTLVAPSDYLEVVAVRR